jgi:hypothetical protein
MIEHDNAALSGNAILDDGAVGPKMTKVIVSFDGNKSHDVYLKTFGDATVFLLEIQEMWLKLRKRDL